MERKWNHAAAAAIGRASHASKYSPVWRCMALHGLLVAVLFAFLYSHLSAIALGQIDEGLRRERNALLRGAGGMLRARVDEHARLDPDSRRPSGLFRHQGQRIAGAFPWYRPSIEQFGEPFNLSVQLNGQARRLRVVAYILPDFDILVLSQEIDGLREYNASLLWSLAVAAVLLLLSALAAAVVIAREQARHSDNRDREALTP